MTPHATSILPSLNIVRAGPQGSAPVVLLHAVSLDLTYWEAQFAVLSRTHEVVAFDWPSHSRSGSLPGEMSFAGLAQVVAAVIERTVQQPAHVVGLSMGSMVAQHFALNYPELVRSLALVGSACTFAGPVRQALRGRAAAIRQGRDARRVAGVAGTLVLPRSSASGGRMSSTAPPRASWLAIPPCRPPCGT